MDAEKDAVAKVRQKWTTGKIEWKEQPLTSPIKGGGKQVRKVQMAFGQYINGCQCGI